MAETELLGTEKAKPLIPDEAHGFAISTEIGPYPLGDPRPTTQALFVWMRPITQSNRAKLQYVNSDAIYGAVPLTREQAQDARQDPNQESLEPLWTAAYRVALRRAKEVEAD